MILIKEHTVPGDTANRFVNYAVNLFEELPTKSSVKKAIKSGSLRIRGFDASTGTFVEKGMTLELYDLQQNTPKPYQEEIEFIFEDDELAIVHKPSGLPTVGNQFRTLENIMAYHRPLPRASKYLKWPKPVHRLDSATSGLVIVAKTTRARYTVGQAFKNRSIQKTYHALVMGKTPPAGIIETPVNNKPSETVFRKVKEIRSLKNNYLTLLQLKPKTGRTHQIRVHCASEGFPIFGDKIYAKSTIRHKGMFLTATRLSFIHPIAMKPIDVSTELPSNFNSRMKKEQQMWERYHKVVSD